VGGLVAANRLRKRLPAATRITLVDREQHHLFQSSLLWLAVGSRHPEQIRRPLALLERRGIEVLTGEVEELDPRNRRIRLGKEEFEGDAMIVSLGAELAPEMIPGLQEAGHNLFTLEGAAGIRNALEGFQGGRVVVLTAAPAYKCPAAPYEAAMLVNSHLRQRGVMDAVVEIHAAEPGPMATAGPEASAGVRSMVEGQGIAYYPGRQIGSVDASGRTLRFNDGATADFDLLIYVPPHRAPGVVRDAGLVAESGWVSVDPGTLLTDAPGVFAIGDVTGIPIPSGKMLPKSGVFAHRQAEVVAANLAAEWAGRPPDRRFDGTGACFIETGSGRAGYGSGDFYAAPAPSMRLRKPSRIWHLGKVLFEKYWLTRWFR
jgi:sulfide:quinone oxidoreductase